MNNNFYLGIDFGTKKMGVAIAQEITKESRPLKLIYNDYINKIQEIILEWNITKIVIGFPHHKKEGHIHSEIKNFTNELIKTINPNIEVILFNEYLSSNDAKNNFAKMRKHGLAKKKKSDYDDISASIILQSWINENIMD